MRNKTRCTKVDSGGLFVKQHRDGGGLGLVGLEMSLQAGMLAFS